MIRVRSLQPFLHDDSGSDFEAEAFVETHDRGVAFADHELELGDAAGLQPEFSGFDEFLADALAASARIGSEIIDTAAVPILADHDGADDDVLRINGNQNIRVASPACEAEVGGGIVVADPQLACLPPSDHGGFVSRPRSAQPQPSPRTRSSTHA